MSFREHCDTELSSEILALIAEGDERAIFAAAAKLEDSERTIRWAAQRALSKARGNQFAVRVVCARLHTGSQRCAALETLADIADRGDKGAVLAVSACLSHDSPHVRCASLEALARISDTGDQHSILASCARLRDANPDVAKAAVQALGKLIGTQDLHVICASLKEANPCVQKEALQLIRSVAANLKEHGLSAVSSRLSDPSADVRRAAVDALAQIADKNGDHIAGVCARLDTRDAITTAFDLSKNQSLQHAAEQALHPLLKEDAFLLGVRAHVQDVDVRGRLLALQVLGNLARHEQRAAVVMCVLLEDREADVRQKTVQLLAEVTADESGEITAAVAERLVDSNTCVRQTALHALVTLAGEGDTRILSAVCLLLKAGKDPSEALKQLADAGDQNAIVAADVLVTTTNLPARNVHELISFCALLRDENQAVRYMAIVTLAQVVAR
mmetsp:Transcript_43496/g.114753  ORF Transcript_43496/g.114753 Transcript_43496/m.114753 type:complete len:445 (-) Transcript_43496:3-1337(-)